MRCLCEEEKWFKEHDPLEVKKTKIRNYMQKYHTTFNYHLVFSSKNGIEVVPDDDTFDGLPITDKQCNEILDKYEMVDSLIAELSK